MQPDDPRARRLYPPWLTLAALATAGVLTYGVYFPAFYGLAVAACRAVFPWFVWYDRYWELTLDIQYAVTLASLPFAGVATFVALRWLAARLVRAWRPGRPRGWLRAGVWSVRVLVVVALLPSAAAFVGTTALPVAAFGPGYYLDGGRHLQRQKCSRCHSPYRPFHFFRPPQQWEITVQRMRELEGAPIDERQQHRIAGYLSTRCSYTDAWMTRAKCLRCHDRAALRATPRSADEWRLLIGRTARISPYAYRPDWVAQVEAYAVERLAVPDEQSAAGASLPDKLAFERRCGRCHELAPTLDRDRNAEGTGSLVRRMMDKAPYLASDEEIAAITRYLDGPLPDGEARSAAFPHDRPVEVPW